jgi:hypothetical protein
LQNAPAIKAYAFPVNNRSKGFDMIDVIRLLEKVATELNEQFTIEVFDSKT